MIVFNRLVACVFALGSIALPGCVAGDAGNDHSAASFDAGTTQRAALEPADCENCVTAGECCEAVTDRPICNFDPEACYAADPGRQATRIRNCRVFIRTAVTAWNMSGQAPPPECRITW
jgi:hypothetical protein